MRHLPSPARVWIDGTVVDGSQAYISVFDRGFLYGDSVYEVTRTVQGVPLFLPAHLDRLAASAERIGIVPPARALCERAVREAQQALGEEAYLRLVLTRGAGELGLDPACADEPLLLCIAKRLRLPEPRLYREGAHLVCTSLRRNAPGHVGPEVKSGNYLSSVLATGEAARRGAYEAVLCDLHGHITEGASSNLFFVRGGRILTPARALGLLPGVTRRVVLEILSAHGVAWEEALLTPAEAVRADEAFLTSSVRGVMPVVRLDERPIGTGKPGPLTRTLMGWYGERIGEPPPG